jgi:hypothetical protein
MTVLNINTDINQQGPSADIDSLDASTARMEQGVRNRSIRPIGTPNPRVGVRVAAGAHPKPHVKRHLSASIQHRNRKQQHEQQRQSRACSHGRHRVVPQRLCHSLGGLSGDFRRDVTGWRRVGWAFELAGRSLGGARHSRGHRRHAARQPSRSAQQAIGRGHKHRDFDGHLSRVIRGA